MTTPDRLGKYEITEVLGRGAMCVVYKGFDPGIRCTVAIKTIRLFNGRFDGERYDAPGRLGARNCVLSISRAGS